jgi:hypothetical protein
MDQRFAEMQGQMDQRFAEMQEQMDQRFAEMQEQMDQRFEQMDQRFEQMQHAQLEIRRDILRLQHGQDMILERLEGQERWLRFVTGNLRDEKGKALEDMFAAALRYGLKNPNISPDKIRLRQKLVDVEGLVFKYGHETEVDLITEDGKLSVFEVKATVKPSEIDWFALKVELVAVQNPDKKVHGIFISLAAGEEVRQRCAKYGLELVD